MASSSFSKAQQTVTSSEEEQTVRMSTGPARATLVPISLVPQPEPEPGLAAYRRLQMLDEDVKRLQAEMSRLWQQTALERQSEFFQRRGQQLAAMQGQGVSIPSTALADMGGGGLQRLSPATGQALSAFQPPQGFLRLTADPWAKVAALEDVVPWGPSAHPDNWRLKEDFHMENPVVVDPQGRRSFRLEFDLRLFKPEEIEVAVKDRLLTVHAKHEETSQGRQGKREYLRQYTIPSDVRSQDLSSKLGQAGILIVSAPVQALPSSDSPAGDEGGDRPLNVNVIPV